MALSIGKPEAQDDGARRRSLVDRLVDRWTARQANPNFASQTRGEAFGGAVGLVAIAGFKSYALTGGFAGAAGIKWVTGLAGGENLPHATGVESQPEPVTQAPPIVPAVNHDPRHQ